MRGWWNAGTRWNSAAWLLASAQLAAPYKLDLNSTDNVKQTAKYMAEDMMSFYNGHLPGGIPGLLPPPYYWWEAGALMGALVDYWYYTGDTTYNNITEQGLLFQVGPNNDYMPPNQTMTEGNDDQGFWGMAAMSAAEYKFQNPPQDKPQWLALAQAVFNTQAARWETQHCGGGLRWQIFTWNNGYTYKNSISQACFFNIAARLALYTGNQSYADWAEKTWDWMVYSQFLENGTYFVYDGAQIENCSKIVPYQWTYNAGGFLHGAAAMYNYSKGGAQEKWRERTEGLLNGTMVFFTGDNNDIMTEVACEPVNLCNLDQQSFKAYLSRWMAATTKWAPWSYDRIKPLLEKSAVAASAQCTGGTNGRMCGLKWTDKGKWDGSTGVGQQMAAMEIVLANMIKHVTSPVTNATGGTSAGDPAAGGSDVGRTDPYTILDSLPPITAKDRAGAYICTIVIILAFLAGLVFMLRDETAGKTPSEKWAGIKSMAIAGGSAAGLFRRAGRHGSKGKGVDKSDSEVSSRGGPTEDDKLHSRVPAEDSYSPPYLHRSTRSEPMLMYGPSNISAMMSREHRLSHPEAQKRDSLRRQAEQSAQYTATKRYA